MVVSIILIPEKSGIRMVKVCPMLEWSVLDKLSKYWQIIIKNLTTWSDLWSISAFSVCFLEQCLKIWIPVYLVLEWNLNTEPEFKPMIRILGTKNARFGIFLTTIYGEMVH